MDYQKMWFLLKELIETKNSWGKNMLLNEMQKLEIKEAKGDNNND